MNIYGKLSDIQAELKAPKDKYNSFGKYSYRSAEGILEAVKPICKKHGCVLTLEDEIKQVGERYYVEAKARLTDIEDGSLVIVTASAREDADKKGMDGSQITGACSSYARKYALNGLFNIDDTKDADTDEFHKQTTPPPAPKTIDLPIGVAEAQNLEKLIRNAQGEAPYEERLSMCLKKVGVNDISDLKQSQYNFLVQILMKGQKK